MLDAAAALTLLPDRMQRALGPFHIGLCLIGQFLRLRCLTEAPDALAASSGTMEQAEWHSAPAVVGDLCMMAAWASITNDSECSRTQRKEDSNGMSLPRTIPSVHREDLRGSTVTAHGRDMTPIARRVTFRWPTGQVSWQTPLAIEVNERGRVRQIAVRDATQRAILAMVLADVALGVVILVIWWALRARQTRSAISLLGRRRGAWTP